MKDKRLWILLYILVLCTACGPLGLPAAEPSPTRIATQPSHATSETASVVLPTGTSAPILPSPTPMFDGIIDNVVIDQQGQLYASGPGAIGVDVRHVARWDGEKWIALENGFQAVGAGLVVDSADRLYTDVLKESEQGMATAIMRWDGAGWEDLTGNFSMVVDALQAGRISSNIPMATLTVDGEDNLYAAGSFQYPSADHTREWPMGYVAKWNHETWTVLGHGFDHVNIYAMAVSTAGKVYVAGEQPRISAGQYGGAGFIALWDGETWTEISTTQLNPCMNIRSLALDKAGGLYANCIRSEAGELIFYWDGTDWITITDQLQGEGPTLYDLAVDEKGHLYIGGSFDAVSGIPARNIASWDGNVWHALEEGVNGQVYALAFDPGGELYAAGFLMEAVGLPEHPVTRWDGETWHALGP